MIITKKENTEIENGRVLPVEILIEIFLNIFPEEENMRRIIMVCKYWKEILMDERFWKQSSNRWFGGQLRDQPEFKSWRSFVLSSSSTYINLLKYDLILNSNSVIIKTESHFPRISFDQTEPLVNNNTNNNNFDRNHQQIANYQTTAFQNHNHYYNLQNHQTEEEEEFDEEEREMRNEQNNNNENVKYGDSAIWFWSCERGHSVIVKKLLLHDRLYELLNLKDSRGRTALYHASRNGHFDIVDFLTSFEAYHEKVKQIVKVQIDTQLYDGTTALLSACQHGHLDVVKLLLSKKPEMLNSFRNSGATALYLASQEGHSHIVEYLLSLENIEVDSDRKSGASPLYIAAQNGNTKVVKLLINAGASVNQKRNSGTTALHVACHEGNYRIVKLLLKNSADVNVLRETGHSSLFIACYQSHHQIVKLLLRHNANINTNPSPLISACQRGQQSIVNLLLAAGADPNIYSNNVTPLTVACASSHSSIVSLLLKYNANPNIARNSDGMTPLAIACQNNSYAIVKSLINAGADPNFIPNGELPLHIAISFSNHSIVRCLLRAKNTVDINQRCTLATSSFSALNFAPIHVAARSSDLRMIKILIANGADYTLPLPDGLIAEKMAKERHKREMGLFLERLRKSSKKKDRFSFVKQTFRKCLFN